MLDLERGWLGPAPVQFADDGGTQLAWAMTDRDRDALHAHLRGWRLCAEQRGAVIEEANR